MKLKKYVHIRHSKTEKQQVIPLYSRDDDREGKKLCLLANNGKKTETVYANLVSDSDPLASSLVIRKDDKVFRAEKYDEADTIPLTRFYHIVKYDEGLHEEFVEAEEEYAQDLSRAKTPEEAAEVELERARYEHLASITDYPNCLYRQDHAKLPNPLDTSELDDTSYMFCNCTKLKSIPELDTSNVMDMRGMFKNCESLPETFPWYIDATKMDEIEKYRDMFRNSGVYHVYFKNPPDCVKDIIPVSAELMGLETASCAKHVLEPGLYKMKDVFPETYRTDESFEGPFGVLGLDTIEEIYDGCESLKTLVPFDTSLTKGFQRMFRGCKSLPEDFPYAVDVSSIEEAGALQDMFDGSSVKRAWLASTAPQSLYYLSSSALGRIESTRADVYLTRRKHTIKELFPNSFESLTSFPFRTAGNVEFHLVPKSGTYDFSSVFEGCKNLAAMDDDGLLSLHGVKSARNMFKGCEKLAKAPALDMSFCTDASGMYYGCTSLTDTSGIDISATKDVSRMFYGCKSLPQSLPHMIDVGHVATKEGFEQMFGGTPVEEISLLNVDTKVRNQLAPSWFGENLKEIHYLEALDWILQDSDVRKLDLQDAVVIRNNDHQLCEIEGLESVNEIVFENVDDATNLIGACRKLGTIGKLTNTEILKSAAGMFSGCRNLSSVPSFSLASCTDTSKMFKDCAALSNLAELDLSHVQAMKEMFRGCPALPEEFPWTIDLSSVTDAENLRNMFLYSSVKKVRFKNADSNMMKSITSDLLGIPDVGVVNIA